MPYRSGGTGPNGYDCSGLTMRAYESAGVSLPRTSRAQWHATTRISSSDLQPGDLIFYASNLNDPSTIYHVAIWAGDGKRVHAPSEGKTVEHVSMYWSNVIGFGRVG